MNQSHLLIERLNEYRATELQKQAENARLAQITTEESPKPFLEKFWTELSNLSEKAQKTSPKQR
jgi:hypothetical protein